jgi:Flp pilus assembly protein TadD
MRRYGLILVACLALAACAGGEEDALVKNWDGSSFLRLADRAAAQGDGFMALQMYEKALAEDPNSLPAQLGYAKSLQNFGERPAAIAAFTALLAKRPNDMELQSALGVLWLGEGDGKQAATYLVQALDRQASPRLFNLLALAHELQDQPSAAMAAYHSGLLLGNDPNLQSNLGLSLVLRNQARQGLRYLQAAAGDPKALPRHRQNLAFGYIALQQPDKAEQILRPEMGDQAAVALLDSYREILAKPTRLQRIRALLSARPS